MLSNFLNMKNLAVFRVQKLNTSNSQSMSGLEKHNDRTVKVSNADPQRSHLNESIKSIDGSLLNSINNHIEKHYSYKTKTGKLRKMRTDVVKADEIIMSASPEILEVLQSEGRLKEWKDTSIKFLEDKFGAEHVLKADLHMDEETPHIHAVVVPMVQTEQGLNLSHKHYFDGRKALSQWQTDYAKAVEHLGIKRGKKKKGKRADHRSIHEFNKMVKDPVNYKSPDLNDYLKEQQQGVIDKFTSFLIQNKSKEMEYKIPQDIMEDAMNRLLANELSLTERIRMMEAKKEKMKELDKRIVNEEQKLKEVILKRKQQEGILKRVGVTKEEVEQKINFSAKLLTNDTFYAEAKKRMNQSNSNEIEDSEKDIDDMRRRKRRSRGGIT